MSEQAAPSSSQTCSPAPDVDKVVTELANLGIKEKRKVTFLLSSQTNFKPSRRKRKRRSRKFLHKQWKS